MGNSPSKAGSLLLSGKAKNRGDLGPDAYLCHSSFGTYLTGQTTMHGSIRGSRTMSQSWVTTTYQPTSLSILSDHTSSPGSRSGNPSCSAVECHAALAPTPTILTAPKEMTSPWEIVLRIVSTRCRSRGDCCAAFSFKFFLFRFRRVSSLSYLPDATSTRRE